MFELKFDKTYDHYFFYKHKEFKSVPEDYYFINKNTFCIADGVTKDLIDGTIAKYPEKIEDLESLTKYPNPSGNYDASKICCDKFVEYINEYREEQITEEIILDVVKRVNTDICKLNENREIDYIFEDVHSCQAVGGIIINDYLYCFSVGDSQITILDKDFNIIFDTPANEKWNDYEMKYFKNGKLDFNWEHQEYRYMVRRFFRNNHTLTHKGECITYGALGEEDAKYYINTFKVDLSSSKYICAYSDGVRPNFGTLKGIQKMINNPESIKESGNEKTLIIYEKK